MSLPQIYTPIYNLGMLQPYQEVGQVLNMDQLRMQTIERQLQWIYTLFGNGIIDNNPLSPSWQIQTVPGDTTGTKIQISPGQGHVAWVYCVTTSPFQITLPVVSATTTFWIYATPTPTSPSDGSVNFVTLTQEVTNEPNTYIGLGGVIASNTNGVQSLTIENNAAYGRVDISLFNSIAAIVNAHHHLGGSANPSQINLQTEVQNKLSGSYIDFLDANDITQGTFDPDRFPPIPHSSLLRIGVLTHPELDSLVDAIEYDTESRLSDLGIANLLILGLAFKRQSGLDTLDAASINEILYVPGVTPDSFSAYYESFAGYGLDGILAPFVPSYIPLAEIDKVNRRIVGTAYTIPASDYITWTTEADFNLAIQTAQGISSSAVSNIQVADIGNGAIELSFPLNYRGVATTDLANWTTGYYFNDELTKTPTSPFPTVVNDNYSVTRYIYQSFSQAQDWSGDDTLEVGFNIAAGSEIGNLSMFLILSTPVSNQNVFLTGSNTEVNLGLSKRVEIYAGDLPAASGLTYVTNLLNFVNTTSQLTQVVGVGFSYGTSSGWDLPEAQFSLYVPDASQIPNASVVAERALLPDVTSAIFIWNTTIYADIGVLTFRFDSNYLSTQFNSVSFDIDSSAVALINNVTVQTRVANDPQSLLSATLYPLTNITVSGDLVSGQVSGLGNIGQYIDIVVTLTAATNLLSTPIVDDLSLSFLSPGASNSKIWDQQIAPTPQDINAWSKADTFSNIAMVPNSPVGPVALQIADASSVGDYTYIRGNSICINSDDGSITETVLHSGASLYATPMQVWNGGASLGLSSPSAYWQLPDGGVVIADTLNDRVVQLDAQDNFVRAIQGNIRLMTSTEPLVALTAVFNPRLGLLWITFSQNVTVANKTVMSISCGSDVISFANAGINVIPFNPDAQGKSATLVASFSAAQVAQIMAWTNPVSVLLGAGAVANAGTSTGLPPVGGSGSGSGGSSGGSGGGSGGGGGPSGLSLPPKEGFMMMGSCGFPTWFIPLYEPRGTGDFAGVTTCPYSASGSTLPAPAAPSSGSSIWSTTTTQLQGPGGQIGSVTLPVVIGEIVFDFMFNPISIQLNASNDWIVGTAGGYSVISYDQFSNQLYNLSNILVPFQAGYLGSAWELSNKNVLVAVPGSSTSTTPQGAVLVYNVPQGNALVTQAYFYGDAVSAVPTADESEFWVAVNDRAGNGQTSRVVRVNTTGRIDWIWGVGILSKPTGLALLPNSSLAVAD